MTGYPRDLVGYAGQPPDPHWPGGARLALNFVVNYEEGGERSVLHGDKVAETLPKWSNRRSRKNRATVRQKKTGQPVKFEMTEQTREAIENYLAAARKKPGEFLFGGRRGRDRPITTRQYARLVGQWIAGIGLDPRFFGTHSLRRTKATLIYRRTGNLRAVQLLLGHKKIESTVRYLGIEVDDALAIAEQVDV